MAVGDRITIADHTYVISEMTPLTAGVTNAIAVKAAPALTLVVATEVNAEGSKPQHLLRFLIESNAPVSQPQPSTPAADDGRPHRTL